MTKGATLSELAARRQLGFLATFDKKLQILRRELERLQRASVDSAMAGGQRSLTEIDRVVRGLVGSGPVYGVDSVTSWAKGALTRLETIRQTNASPTKEDLAWLATEIQELGRLREEAVKTAKEDLDRGGKAKTLKRPSSAPPPMPKPPATPLRLGKPLPPPIGGALRKDAPLDEAAKKETLPATDTPKPSPEREEKSHESGAAVQMMPVSALVAAQTESIRKKVVSALSDAGFTVREVPSGKPPIGLIQEESPDLVVVDVDDPAPGGAALVDIMSRDPLTDFIPVLRLATSMVSPYSNAIPKPIDPERLVAEAGKLTGQEIELGLDNKGLRDLTLEELIEFVSSEIRAGVIEAATGSDVRKSFQVLEKGPLVASIWALIARLRRVAAEGSNGKIRFAPTTHGPIGMMALDEAESVLDPASREMVNESDLAALSGLSAVVADDDLEIRAVFDKVLSEAGMKVRTAGNGKEALAMIRENQPDVIITDILMPEMDGWELATKLKWDFALRHIPIIMLSWKEDFLQRVRELKAQADDYMLKEVDRKQILSRVAGVLKPRFSFEQRLVDEGEVTGRIERAGVVRVLKAAMDLRPNCRITLRENWNYFEANVIGGELASVNRTGTDGSFASGMPALERLLGVTSGRFSVVQAVDVSKKQFLDGTAAAIRQATERLNSLNNQVVEGALINITKIDLNEEVIEVYSKVIPPKLKTLVQNLAKGKLPKNLVLEAAASTETLETLLLDLIRMGAVQGIVSTERKLDPSKISAKPELVSHTVFDAEQKSEPSGTIPISIDDVSAFEPIPSDGPIPMLGEPSPVRQRQSRVWQVFAIIFFLGFAAMAALYFLKIENEAQGADAKETIPAAPAITEKSEPVPAPTAPPATSRETPPTAEQPAPNAEPAPSTDSQPDRESATEEKESEPQATAPEKAEPSRTEKKESGDSTREEEKEREGKTAASASTEPTGLLAISVPSDAPGPIRVSVDGALRGQAPLKLKLPPGLHELVFSYEGKRSIKMVLIRVDEVKSIDAVVPK